MFDEEQFATNNFKAVKGVYEVLNKNHGFMSYIVYTRT